MVMVFPFLLQEPKVTAPFAETHIFISVYPANRGVAAGVDCELASLVFLETVRFPPFVGATAAAAGRVVQTTLIAPPVIVSPET